MDIWILDSKFEKYNWEWNKVIFKEGMTRNIYGQQAFDPKSFGIVKKASFGVVVVKGEVQLQLCGLQNFSFHLG